MTGAHHYTVRIRFRERPGNHLACSQIIYDKEAALEHGIKTFIMSLAEATSLFGRLLDRHDLDMHSISVVRNSRYYPFPELSVIMFKELS